MIMQHFSTGKPTPQTLCRVLVSELISRVHMSKSIVAGDGAPIKLQHRRRQERHLVVMANRLQYCRAGMRGMGRSRGRRIAFV